MRKLWIYSLLLLWTSTLCGQDNDHTSLIKTLDTKVPKFMKQKNVPGMAVAVFNNGEAIFQQGYGWANVGTHKKVTGQTGFNIGSVSKLFTAVAIMKLVEEGKIALDTPVEHYLTRWKLPNSQFDKNKVTIRRLLNHTGGISVHGYPGFKVKRTLPSLEASLNGENGPVRANEPVKIIIEPNTKFRYSGGGYTLLQLVVEEVTKMPFHKYAKKTIFKPLGMQNTSFKINQKILKNSAIPYDAEAKRLPFEFFTAQGAAGLHTTLDDFILFANELLNGHKVLSEATIQEMIQPTAVSQGHYGLGFSILKFGGLKFIGHAGSNTGWQSAFFIDFKTKSGMIMMTNGDEGKRVLQNTLKTWAQWKYKK
ncbi:serine hydrolase domain-containing protein [Flavobacteriaceae bacterium S356]|uniref:Serine hydrolase domain-containing protein n=1 Tax=Asprobacillus argus TaxID=3076534 RepID=A0ABU3LFE3_9FLAO|nr:serine hydrolase domain-containing protein [Flavobacteriaceae bacterium S356]